MYRKQKETSCRTRVLVGLGLPAKGRCVALPVGPMAPSRGPVMAEMAFIACAVMSFIAGITDVMDLIAFR